MMTSKEMTRFGLKWNGPTSFIPTEMSDGYWTPWHLAAERLNAQSALIEQKDKEIQRLRDLITLLVENLHEDDDGPDAPGHSHETPGIWDEENGGLSGKACQWCEIWGQALAVAYPNRPANSNADRL